MTPEILFDNINLLPPIARQEVFDFVDFLVHKYKDNEALQNQMQLSEKGKAFLDERMQSMAANPDKLSTWKDVKQRLYAKYNWE